MTVDKLDLDSITVTPRTAPRRASRIPRQYNKPEMQQFGDAGAAYHQETLESMQQFKRGKAIRRGELKRVRDKKLRQKMYIEEDRARSAAASAAQVDHLLRSKDYGYLEPGVGEKTQRYKQQDIVKHADLQTTNKAFHLNLDFGSYDVQFSRNGRYLLSGGRKGHISLIDWTRFKPLAEIHVKETVRCVEFLHDHTFFAAAQKNDTFIYDSTGVELHALQNFNTPALALTYLPYHFLLVSTGPTGLIAYLDTSMGKTVSEIKSHLGPCSVLEHDPQTAVCYTGHTSGIVNGWVPSLNEAAVSIPAARSCPITSIAINNNMLAASSAEGVTRVFDIRNTYREMCKLTTPTPVKTSSLSQQSILALGFGPHVQCWKMAGSQKEMYLNQLYAADAVSRVRFCPYEDFLGIGSARGVSTMLVPGSGEPDFDAKEASPFDNAKQTGERVIRTVLEKLQPDMISLNPNLIGRADPTMKPEPMQKTAVEATTKEKNRMRGKNSAKKKWKRKKLMNVTDNFTQEMEQTKADNLRRIEIQKRHGKKGGVQAKSVLDRFK